MKKESRKYFYLNNKGTEGAVFLTQVIDWLHLFNKNDVSFELIQLFHIKDIIYPKFIKTQLKHVEKKSNILYGFLFFFPSKGVTVYINTLFLFLKLFRYLIVNDKIVIFSRALIGREIYYIKKLFPSKILFVFDARAASAEENKYTALKTNDFSRGRYKMIANIYYLEFKTLLTADRIFSVSNGLTKYFVTNFNMDSNKNISYPCLSDASKFYYDPNERRQVRSELKISDDTKVLIYAGGIAAKWHMANFMLIFFGELSKHNENVRFLFLSNDEKGFNKIMNIFPTLISKTLFRKVSNDKVYKYLNAADVGLLFRENTIMNNVASPTKFAEYMLCGLPVLISEGVGDYVKYTFENNSGIVITQNELYNLNSFDYLSFLKLNFDRKRIAELGLKYFTKESIVTSLIEVFKND